MSSDEKSDRLKRREKRQQVKDAAVGDVCVNLNNDLQACPLPQKKTAYESRKTQKSGKDDKEIKKNDND